MLQYSVALFPLMSPDIPRNRLTVSMLQQELSTVLLLHFSVARCMANTSLVSETLLTKSERRPYVWPDGAQMRDKAVA